MGRARMAMKKSPKDMVSFRCKTTVNTVRNRKTTKYISLEDVWR